MRHLLAILGIENPAGIPGRYPGAPSLTTRAGLTACYVLALIAAVGLSGCAAPEPVGSVSVEPQEFRLPFAEAVDVRFTWTPKTPLSAQMDKHTGRPTVFVHLLDENNRVVRTFDHPLPADWEANTPLSYPLTVAQSALSTALPAGTYTLTAGLYSVDWGYRWSLATDAAEVATREYPIATVEIPPPSEAGPEFTFVSGLLPGQSGDQQVPEYRVFGGDARIQVNGLTPPGALLFEVLVHDPEVQAPVLEVFADCSPETVVIAHTAVQPIVVPLAPDFEGPACTVSFTFQGALAGCAPQCPVVLQQAAFRAAP